METREILKLYKNILKIHKRKLPHEVRKFGDDYVRNEWKLHKNVTPSNAVTFITQWKDYFKVLKSQPEVIGRDLKPSQVESLGDEQKQQLNTLKEEALSSYKSSTS